MKDASTFSYAPSRSRLLRAVKTKPQETVTLQIAWWFSCGLSTLKRFVVW